MPWTHWVSSAYWFLYVAGFLLVAVWESVAPQRELKQLTERRWRSHGLLLACSVALAGLVIRLSPVALAMQMADQPYRLLNQPALPFPVQFILALFLLDFVRYATHWGFHHVALLWRVHEVHHSDPDYDVSTAARFHPMEVLADQGAFLFAVALLAPPPLAVFCSGMLTVVLNLMVHANASLPAWLEPKMRLLFVTPDLHRIHHSIEFNEQNRNYGQTFVLWDRMLGTFLAEPKAGQSHMQTGLSEVLSGDPNSVAFLLKEPFLPHVAEIEKGPAPGRTPFV